MDMGAFSFAFTITSVWVENPWIWGAFLMAIFTFASVWIENQWGWAFSLAFTITSVWVENPWIWGAFSLAFTFTIFFIKNPWVWAFPRSLTFTSFEVHDFGWRTIFLAFTLTS